MTRRGTAVLVVHAGLPEVLACDWVARHTGALYGPDDKGIPLSGDGPLVPGPGAGDRGLLELEDVNWFEDAQLVQAAPLARWEAFLGADTEQPDLWLAHTPETGLVEGVHVGLEVHVPAAWADPAGRTPIAAEQLDRLRAVRELLAAPAAPTTALGAGAGAAAVDLREMDYEAAIVELGAALADPAGRQELLALVFNDRGLRDAAFVLTARDGDWPGLAAAAAAAGRHAAATGDHSVYGPLASLGACAWIAGRQEEAAAMLGSVPPQDPAHRFAELAGRLCGRGVEGEQWVERMAAIDPRTAVDFRSTVAAGPHPAPPAAVRHWLDGQSLSAAVLAAPAQAAVGAGAAVIDLSTGARRVTAAPAAPATAAASPAAARRGAPQTGMGR